MSKYDGIKDLLRGRAEPIELSLDELGEMLPGGLPSSASRHFAWWSNNDDTHVQSKAWSSAGFSAEPDLATRTVRFVPQ